MSLSTTDTAMSLCPVPDCENQLSPGTRLCDVHVISLLRHQNPFPGIHLIKIPAKNKEIVTIFPLPKNSQRFLSRVTTITSDWKKSNVTDFRIETVAEIHPSPYQIKTYNAYKEHIANLREGNGGANVMALYHGTHQHCNPIILKEDDSAHPKPTLCKSSDCGICGVILNGFDPEKIGKNERGETFQRLGMGFYFAPNPSKAHYYSRGAQKLHPHDPNRYTQVLLRCLVVCGNPYNETVVNQTRTSPPAEYDSVYGGVGTCKSRGHGPLNWPEYAVYDPRAALAVEYIVYSYSSTSEF
ncbi:hypothetical protein G9A89_010154 [Geosiphon pyriformis]|nr:hypothetical protein G9A89_010154 [Geosiphon pyriformis]